MHFPANEVGITIAKNACLYIPPNIAGFVGGDHVAMLLATNARHRGKTVVALDIGTNTEISLIHQGHHFPVPVHPVRHLKGLIFVTGCEPFQGRLNGSLLIKML